MRSAPLRCRGVSWECRQFNSGEGGPSCRPSGQLRWQQTGRWRLPWTWGDHRLKASSSPRRWCERGVLGHPVGRTGGYIYLTYKFNWVKTKRIRKISLTAHSGSFCQIWLWWILPIAHRTCNRTHWLFSQLTHIKISTICFIMISIWV